MTLNRRQFIGSTLAAGLVAAVETPAMAMGIRPDARLFALARAELDRLGNRIARRDVVGISDFGNPSRAARFHLLDMAGGRLSSFLVAHGRGSDPMNSGWVQKFSNQYNSNATSAGAYATGAYYRGKHGRSMRLLGLDPTNSNAEGRAIVVHSAWYVSPAILQKQGRIGRSQGCFVFSEHDLDEILTRLGPGRLLLAGKFG